MNSLTKDTDKWTGWNLKTENKDNMREAGIIDPFKVTRSALENASSVAGTILLTECVVADEPSDNAAPSMPGMDNMMF